MIPTCLVALVLSAALLGLGPTPPMGDQSTPPAATTPEGERLDCLTPGRVEAIREDPDRMREVFARCKRELREDVPFARRGLERHAVLASLVAYRMARYGANTDVLLPPLLRAEELDCDNYAWLTFHLVRRGWGERHALRMRRAGWDHGAIGNHAQVHAGRLLVDPTTNVVAKVRYRELLDGVPAHRVVTFPRRADIEEFGVRVVDAVANGLYKPSDVLYWVDFSSWRNYL